MELKVHISHFTDTSISGQGGRYAFGTDISKAVAAIREFADLLEMGSQDRNWAIPNPGHPILQEVRLTQTAKRDDFAMTELTFVMAETIGGQNG